jgi:Trk-type K+ transport system membrane component
VIGTVVFYFLERNSTLCEHGFVGQWIGAFFCSVTPRTAGFNVIDMTSISMAAVLVTIMLMYIGASPGSTGGGIKTTVFAVGILNIYNAAVGRKKIEFRRREIAETSVNKAFSIITISLIAISLFTLLLTLSEPDKKLGDLMFETFSAYGTVGLTLGVTPNLSEAGKLILTLTMFAGRVGLFTIFIGLLPDAHNNHYRLPEEDVIVV